MKETIPSMCQNYEIISQGTGSRDIEQNSMAKNLSTYEHISRIQDLTSWPETKEIVLIVARMTLETLDNVMGYDRNSRMIMEDCRKKNQKGPKIGHGRVGKNSLPMCYAGGLEWYYLWEQ